MELLGFCLHNTYFSFQNKFYEQVEGVAMGSPISPIMANLYMEYFEGRAIRSAANPPWVWYRFVDDTWVIQQQSSKQEFLDHINSKDPAIKFTIEGTQRNGAIPFLDTLLTLQADNSLSITNPLTLTSTCNGTATIVFLLSTASQVHSPTGQKLYVLPQSFSRRNLLTLGMQWGSAINPQAINKVQNKILNSNQVDQGNIQHNTNNNNQPLVNNNQDASTTTTSPVPMNTIGQPI